MASTITKATLTVSINEVITLNGSSINSINDLEIPNVYNIDKRIMTIPESQEITVISFAASLPAEGTFVRGDMKYLRITNKDAVNYARIRVGKTGADTFDTQLNAGQSFIMGNALESVSETQVTFAAYQNADFINMQAYIAPIDIEYFVAST